MSTSRPPPPRHHRDEHALRQLDHHRRARHRDDVRRRPPDPEADASTQAGKWEKSRFMGVEITGKTLGLIGCGNIGSIVCRPRAIGLKMKVIAYDPFLSKERAEELGVEKVELDELLKRADFITLHVPLTDKTRNILSAEAIAKMKPGVRIINCARGGLVDEAALAEALKSGHVAGAASTCSRPSRPRRARCSVLPNVVCTPHLGASTTEAQENVALQVAEQMSDYLLRRGPTRSTCRRSRRKKRRGSSPSSSLPTCSAPLPAS
jgi:D-3-phosphoglycerate dehydrogenase